MELLVISVGLLSGGVAFFLLLAAGHLTDRPVCYLRILIASLLSGIYGSICLLPDCFFFAQWYVRFLVLMLLALVAYGMDRGAFYPTGLFLAMQFAVSGGREDLMTLALSLAGAVGVVICLLVRRQGRVAVELNYKDRKVLLTALKDTGNTLKDPVTGRDVLVIGPSAAYRLVGLTKDQLKDPIGTLSQQRIKGLRLIPYRTIDRMDGMLLGMALKRSRVGSRKGTIVVAFAPEEICVDKKVEALTGGMV